MLINDSQKQQFYRQGYFVIPNVIPQEEVKRALKAINSSLGKGLPPEKMEQFKNRSFCPELMTQPLLMDIFSNTPACSIAESCIGKGKLKNIHEAQIALRFPIDAAEPLTLNPHIDGFYYPSNGVEEGQIFSFTALAGVYLNDVDEEWAGNFTVWPGSHLVLQQYFQTHALDPASGGRVPVDLPEALQIKAKAGDLIFCHYLLAHAAAINISPNIRYALFFRLEHLDHDRNRISSMQNAWDEWEGMEKFNS